MPAAMPKIRICIPLVLLNNYSDWPQKKCFFALFALRIICIFNPINKNERIY